MNRTFLFRFRQKYDFNIMQAFNVLGGCCVNLSLYNTCNPLGIPTLGKPIHFVLIPIIFPKTCTQ